MSKRCCGVGVAMVTMALAASPARADDGPRSRTTAQALSGVGAGVSSAAILAAFLVGDGTTYNGDWTPGHVNMPLLYGGLGASLVTPSLGEYYAGQYLTWGEAVRAGAGVVALLGVAVGEQDARCDSIDDPNVTCKSITRAGVVLLSVAAIAYVGGVAYDVMDAADAVDRHNARGVIIVPIAGMTGGTSAGVAVMGSF